MCLFRSLHRLIDLKLVGCCVAVESWVCELLLAVAARVLLLRLLQVPDLVAPLEAVLDNFGGGDMLTARAAAGALDIIRNGGLDLVATSTGLSRVIRRASKAIVMKFILFAFSSW